jgi:23S rRNA (adenine-N6)-dimethyltransferase
MPRRKTVAVANIPFGITTKILRRLLVEEGLARADMIVQAEVARKRGTGGGTLLNAGWEPWFEFGTERGSRRRRSARGRVTRRCRRHAP